MDVRLANELSRLGLTSDEGRCYLALLGRGRLTARELCAATGISRGRIYDVIGGLLGKGVAFEATAGIRSFEAVSPSVAINNLLEKRRMDVKEIEDSARQVAESLEAAAVETEAPASLLEILRHRATVAERCADLEHAATDEILFFVRNVHQVGGELTVERQALERGVSLRAVYESSLLDTDYAATIDRFLAAGGEARHVATLPMRLTVVDRRVTMLPLEEPALDARSFTVLVIRNAGVSFLAASAFERTWAEGNAVRRRRARTQPRRSGD